MSNQTRTSCLTPSVLLLFVFIATVAADDSIEEMIEQATKAGENGQHDNAVRLASAVIAKDPSSATAYYVRGRERFRLGQARESVADFDKYIELKPEVAARQWERGIACFYADMYEQGAKQFESYQKFDGHDVENSVWRYLCLVPGIGVQSARATMLPIENDRRIPMMQIYDLYRGKLQPDAVLAAARADQPDENMLEARLFYANLYIGLWYEAQGDQAQARRFIESASNERLKNNRQLNRYMWDVARIHKLLRARLGGGQKNLTEGR